MTISSLKALTAKSIIHRALPTSDLNNDSKEFVALVDKYFDNIKTYFKKNNFNETECLDLINLHQPICPNTEELPPAKRGDKLSKYKDELSKYLRISALKSCKIVSKNLIDRDIYISQKNSETKKPSNEELCILAAIQGDTDKIESLSNEVNITEIMDENNSTLLIYAAANGHTETAIALIGMGADEIDKQDNDGCSAFMHAAANGHTETAIKLKKMGAEIDKEANSRYSKSKDAFYGRTALILAAINGHTGAAIALIGMGAEIDKQDYIGYTALILAAMNGHTGAAIALIGIGAEKDKQDNNE